MDALINNHSSDMLLGGVSLRQIVSEVGTPLYIYDADKIRSNYRTFLRAFASRLNRFRVLFSLKANFVPAVAGILVEEGAGLDCSSRFDLDLSEALRVPRDMILFNACFPGPDLLSRIAQQHIPVSFNDLSDFDHFATLVGACDFDAPVSFRLSLPRFPKEHSIALSGSRFGMAREQLLEAYEAAARLGFQRFGIHAMSGSNVLDPLYFAHVAGYLGQTAELLLKRTGFRVEFIDVGGGFGIPYTEGEAFLDIDLVAEEVSKSMTRTLSGWGEALPTLIAEPGRFLAGNAGLLVATVCGVKRGQPTHVGIDASTNIFMRRVLYGTSHRIQVISDHNVLEKPDPEPMTICGQLCDNHDVLATGVPLRAVRPGDLLVIHDAGAYGTVRASNFGGMPLPAEVLVSGGTYRIVRRRQTFQDFARSFVLPAGIG